MDTKKLRQKILDLAIHGKLVPQDPNDEPASVLLERIRKEKEQLIKEGKIKAPKKVKSAGDTSHYPKEVSFEVPEGWCWCKITDVVDKLTDGTHNSPKSYPSGTYMYVTAKNIKNGGLDLSNITYVNEEVHREIYSRCNPEKGDILYIKDGATCGISTINNLDVEFSLLSSVALIKPNKNVLNTYLNLFLQSAFCYRNVRESMKGVGITRIILKQMELWDIPLPPYAEQNRIVTAAEQLLQIAGGIEREQIELGENIEKAKARILDLAIHGKLVPQDPSDEPAIELLKRINPNFTPSDNLHYEGDLPDGWCFAQLQEVAEYGDTSNVDVSSIDPFNWVLELEDIEKDTAFIIEKRTKAEREINGVRHSFRKGQILYSKLRTYLNKVLIAPEDGFCTTEIVPITASKALLSEYLLIVLRSPYFMEYTSSCGYGVKMPRLGTNDAKKAIIPIPPIAEQVRIVKKVSDLMGVISSL